MQTETISHNINRQEPEGVPCELDEKCGAPFKVWFPAGRPNPETESEAYAAWYKNQVLLSPGDRERTSFYESKNLTLQEFEARYEQG